MHNRTGSAIAPRTKNQMIEVMLQSVATEFDKPLDLIALNCEFLSQSLAAKIVEDAGEHVLEKSVANTTEKAIEKSTAPTVEPALTKSTKLSDETIAAMRDSIADISDSALYLNRLVANFVEMTLCLQGALTAEHQQVDLCSVLQDICADSAEVYRAIGVKLAVDCGQSTSLCTVADRAFVERLCLNLLSNGLRACSGAGTVAFSLCAGEDEHVLRVTDDGCGFPAAAALSAFEPMQGRCLPHKEGFEHGAGIGLYLCGEYCRLMGWRIAIVPQTRGTMIEVRIPAVREEALSALRFHSSEHEQTYQKQATRRAVLRELRTVPGLAHLGKR